MVGEMSPVTVIAHYSIAVDGVLYMVEMSRYSGDPLFVIEYIPLMAIPRGFLLEHKDGIVISDNEIFADGSKWIRYELDGNN